MEGYKIKIFIAYMESEVKGFVISQIHPTYTSYGRKVGIFGWLCAEDFEVCRELMRACEIFMAKNKMRKLRGPINLPMVSGKGIQTHGFQEPMLYGLACTDPESYILEHLNKLGYEFESEYTCLKVVSKSWKKGNRVDPGIKLKCLTLDEIRNIKEDVRELAKESFYGIIPDSSGFDEKYSEVVSALESLPPSYYELKKPFNPDEWSDVAHFREAWQECDMKNIIGFWPVAYERETNKLVGILITYPDVFEIHITGKSTRNNVDTAMVHKDFSGKGIFSALNNIGQINCNVHGITYFEGTYVWTRNSKGVNNERAIATIFSHCTPIRTYMVLEKNIKRSQI